MENLFELVILVVLLIVATAATAYLNGAWNAKKIEITKEQWTLLRWIAGTAVWAAEQASRSGVIDKNYKLDYAINFIKKELEMRGLPAIKTEQLMIAVNAVVAQELNHKKIVPPEPEPAK